MKKKSMIQHENTCMRTIGRTTDRWCSVRHWVRILLYLFLCMLAFVYGRYLLVEHNLYVSELLLLFGDALTSSMQLCNVLYALFLCCCCFCTYCTGAQCTFEPVRTCL